MSNNAKRHGLGLPVVDRTSGQSSFSSGYIPASNPQRPSKFEREFDLAVQARQPIKPDVPTETSSEEFTFEVPKRLMRRYQDQKAEIRHFTAPLNTYKKPGHIRGQPNHPNRTPKKVRPLPTVNVRVIMRSGTAEVTGKMPGKERQVPWANMCIV